VTFAGTPDRVESRLVPEAGFPLDTFPVSGLPRKPSAAQLRAAWRASAAPAHCLAILRRRRPDVVLGAGGYVAGPMVVAARLRRIPAAVTEADAHLGLANRLAAPFAQRLLLAYDIPGRTGSKVRVVGRPIPLAHRGASHEEGRRQFGFPADAPVVAVFGALAGARSLNELAVSAWGDEGPAVLHISGERDYESLRPRVSRDGYVLLAQTDHFGDALAAADVAVSRAGGTVWELAAAGVPSVLVPYPHATADHQAANAHWMERAGAAVVVPDSQLTPERLRVEIDALLGDRERLAAMARASASLGRPDAAQRIATEVLAAARTRSRG